jgi:hypothetical protein
MLFSVNWLRLGERSVDGYFCLGLPPHGREDSYLSMATPSD